MHVIRGLTDKFNYHRVKVCLDKVELGLAHHFLRSAVAAHTQSAMIFEERERRDSDNTSTDGNIHTKLRYPFWQVFW